LANSPPSTARLLKHPLCGLYRFCEIFIGRDISAHPEIGIKNAIFIRMGLDGRQARNMIVIFYGCHTSLLAKFDASPYAFDLK
jgi:hypothetical protein